MMLVHQLKFPRISIYWSAGRFVSDLQYLKQKSWYHLWRVRSCSLHCVSNNEHLRLQVLYSFSRDVEADLRQAQHCRQKWDAGKSGRRFPVHYASVGSPFGATVYKFRGEFWKQTTEAARDAGGRKRGPRQEVWNYRGSTTNIRDKTFQILFQLILQRVVLLQLIQGSRLPSYNRSLLVRN